MQKNDVRKTLSQGKRTAMRARVRRHFKEVKEMREIGFEYKGGRYEMPEEEFFGDAFK